MSQGSLWARLHLQGLEFVPSLTKFSLSQTLYTVKCEVSPPEGKDTCTAGALCGMTLKVKCLDGVAAESASLLYQILPDENNWAISGKTSGILQPAMVVSNLFVSN